MNIINGFKERGLFMDLIEIKQELDKMTTRVEDFRGSL